MIHDGRLLYDVMDGRQRPDTIFVLTQSGRFGRDHFEVKLDLEAMAPF